MAARKLKSKSIQTPFEKARKQLLAWYDKEGRDLPWRVKQGRDANPYHVWLSEIMAQQTTLAAVIPYFLKFIEKWPTVQDLAATSQEEVMKEWAGLGYYSRARNLHKAARILAVSDFPKTVPELKKLPGVGDYTSAAIASIVFHEPAVVVDGNVERVMARYFAVHEPLPKSKPLLKQQAALFYQDEFKRPGDLAQALMDLGAMICVPKNPRCGMCPLNENCKAYREGSADSLPARLKSRARPKRYGHVYWVTDRQGRVLMHRRPEKGLLAGMTGLPTSTWEEERRKIEEPNILKAGVCKQLKASVIHTFTHFDLNLELKTATMEDIDDPAYFWIQKDSVAASGLPTVFKKAYKIFEKPENIEVADITLYT